MQMRAIDQYYKSHNAPIQYTTKNRMWAFLFWIVHCTIWAGAFGDLWIMSI